MIPRTSRARGSRNRSTFGQRGRAAPPASLVQTREPDGPHPSPLRLHEPGRGPIRPPRPLTELSAGRGRNSIKNCTCRAPWGRKRRGTRGSLQTREPSGLLGVHRDASADQGPPSPASRAVGGGSGPDRGQGGVRTRLTMDPFPYCSAPKGFRRVPTPLSGGNPACQRPLAPTGPVSWTVADREMFRGPPRASALIHRPGQPRHLAEPRPLSRPARPVE